MLNWWIKNEHIIFFHYKLFKNSCKAKSVLCVELHFLSTSNRYFLGPIFPSIPSWRVDGSSGYGRTGCHCRDSAIFVIDFWIWYFCAAKKKFHQNFNFQNLVLPSNCLIYPSNKHHILLLLEISRWPYEVDIEVKKRSFLISTNALHFFVGLLCTSYWIFSLSDGLQMGL